jgi:hypothetical protein
VSILDYMYVCGGMVAKLSGEFRRKGRFDVWMDEFQPESHRQTAYDKISSLSSVRSDEFALFELLICPGI